MHRVRSTRPAWMLHNCIVCRHSAFAGACSVKCFVRFALDLLLLLLIRAYLWASLSSLPPASQNQEAQVHRAQSWTAQLDPAWALKAVDLFPSGLETSRRMHARSCACARCPPMTSLYESFGVVDDERAQLDVLAEFNGVGLARVCDWTRRRLGALPGGAREHCRDEGTLPRAVLGAHAEDGCHACSAGACVAHS